MISEDRLARALHDVADGVVAPEVDLSAVRSRARARRTRAVSAAAVTTAVAMIVAGTSLLGGGDRSSTLPAASPLPSTAMSAVSPDGYTSAQYGFTIVPPPGWLVDAADRAWIEEDDALDWMSPAHDVFTPLDGDVRVSAWSVPLAPSSPVGSRAALEAWIEEHCLVSGTSPCTGIADRAVEVCPQLMDCTEGLLVPFSDTVQAFFLSSSHGTDTMTVVAVWRSETHSSVVPYGGARTLLERFLDSMGVWPSPSG
ncbi:MAG TPA: hypothetical protein PKX29_12630 [Phycicoccus sp.]|jgi:hypothetical protein|nr:hypothetical protein [Phycicoccus sp.]